MIFLIDRKSRKIPKENKLPEYLKSDRYTRVERFCGYWKSTDRFDFYDALRALGRAKRDEAAVNPKWSSGDDEEEEEEGGCSSCLTLEIIILTLYFVCLRGASFVSSSSNLASRQQQQQQLSYAEEAKLEKHKLRFMLPSSSEETRQQSRLSIWHLLPY